MNVMIVGAGLGTRVRNITFEMIPKFLIQIDTFYGLYYILEYWKQYAEHIYFVIHPQFVPITQYYIEQFHPNLSITLVPFEESAGTAFTIQDTIKKYEKDICEKPLFITWCDIYPTENEKIPFDSFKQNDVTIFLHGNECRYLYDMNAHHIYNIGRTGGNIIGMYYFMFPEQILQLPIEKGYDIVDYLNMFQRKNYHTLQTFEDFGDESKIIHLRNKKLHNTSLHHRHFNQMNIRNGNIMKKSTTDQGKDIIQKEIQWYQYILNSKNHTLPIPTIHTTGRDYIIMEYLHEYEPLYEYLKKRNAELEFREILPKLLEEVNHVHSFEKKSISKVEFLWNVKYEIHDKVFERLENIKPILQTFSNIKFVNDTQIISLDTLLEKIKSVILQEYESRSSFDFHFIHGDLNFSNILIHPTTKSIKFIDPRGYFGKSLLFGCKEYDYAKILYAIYGYDLFNINPSFQPSDVNIEENSIHFQIPAFQISPHLLKKHFTKIHYAYMILIWLCLAQYNKNNYWKCVCSYFYSLYLGTLIFH
jgi:RIO-like serine/threonine protein kinase